MLYVNPLETGYGARVDAALKGAAREGRAVEEFERFFLYTLLREMRRTVPRDDLWGDSQARQVAEDMLDDVLAGEMAKSGQMGLGKQIQEQLRQQAEATVTRPLEASGKGIALRAVRAEIPLHDEVRGVGIEPEKRSSGAAGLPINHAGIPLRGQE
ncbi:MAG: rod-binding protein [Candidatus Hydrogenedentes bacterium]|nr:rod-binding protein [Candidatus Hydrogenedentota bacterium]